MQLREASPQDIPEIISVLRASLGEAKLQKSEGIWNYKHIENPFGKSLVLVALENEKIIGVRAFMRWTWKFGANVFTTYRAVDTATHPKHQGKGVFKKLTLKAIEIAKGQGDHFIFNTPNSQSKPGYLKMGWEEVDKVKIQIIPVTPFRWQFGNRENTYSINKEVASSVLENLIENYNRKKESENRFFTPKSMEFIAWRYENNPLQKYQVKATKDFYCAVYVKEHEKFKELRVAENIFINKMGSKKAWEHIKELGNKYGVQMISTKPEKYAPLICFAGNFGPMLTVKNLNMIDGENKLIDLNNWSYTLGDLELF